MNAKELFTNKYHKIRIVHYTQWLHTKWITVLLMYCGFELNELIMCEFHVIFDMDFISSCYSPIWAKYNNKQTIQI